MPAGCPREDRTTDQPDNAGRFVVEVHQVVHDLTGKLLLDKVVHHAYRIREGLIVRMDIE